MIRRPPRSTLFPYNDALPILLWVRLGLRAPEAAATLPLRFPCRRQRPSSSTVSPRGDRPHENRPHHRRLRFQRDRKSTRLNSSHANISYAVFCLKKKKKKQTTLPHYIRHHLRYTTHTHHFSPSHTSLNLLTYLHVY